MQDNAVSRWLSPLIAFCLSFTIIATLAPVTGIQVERQLDFWLLWLGTMLILALPLCYLEIALAKRSGTTALDALSSLTREAEASPRWRIAGWLAVVFIPFLTGGMLSGAGQMLGNYAQTGLAANLIFVAIAVVAVLISFIPRQFIVLLTTAGVLGTLVLANVMGTALPAWKVTPVEFSEWGSATVLALVASGLGLGLYWQSSLAQVKTQKAATQTVLPVWIAQLLAVVAYGFFAINAQIPSFIFVFAVIMAAALLLQMAREQLQQRKLAPVIQWLILLAAVFVWAVPAVDQIFNPLLMLWGMLICLIYALFAGLIMKISHLRKSLNFSNEAFYNIWRISVRIVIPLAIVIAMIAVVGKLF